MLSGVGSTDDRWDTCSRSCQWECVGKAAGCVANLHSTGWTGRAAGQFVKSDRGDRGRASDHKRVKV
jgi:hypothetical protein